MRSGKEEKQENVQHEAELAERIRRRDRRAFGELIELYQKRLFRFAYGFLQDSEDAMEIVQEAFIRFYEKIDRWQSGTSCAPWLYRITRNLCIDHYRKHGKRRRMTDGLEDAREKNMSSLWPSHERQEKEQLMELVDRSLHSLSERQRAVFILKHQEGYKLEEIAASFGTAVGTVKTLHHRAIGRIRRLLRAQMVKEGK